MPAWVLRAQGVGRPGGRVVPTTDHREGWCTGGVPAGHSLLFCLAGTSLPALKRRDLRRVTAWKPCLPQERKHPRPSAPAPGCTHLPEDPRFRRGNGIRRAGGLGQAERRMQSALSLVLPVLLVLIPRAAPPGHAGDALRPEAWPRRRAGRGPLPVAGGRWPVARGRNGRGERPPPRWRRRPWSDSSDSSAAAVGWLVERRKWRHWRQCTLPCGLGGGNGMPEWWAGAGVEWPGGFWPGQAYPSGEALRLPQGQEVATRARLARATGATAPLAGPWTKRAACAKRTRRGHKRPVPSPAPLSVFRAPHAVWSARGKWL